MSELLSLPKFNRETFFGQMSDFVDDENEDLNEEIIIDDDDESGANGGLYGRHHKHADLDLDMEWKTQSLPSLGRVSSEQTLESSGDEFAALRRAAPTRMLKSRNVSGFLFHFNFNSYCRCIKHIIDLVTTEVQKNDFIAN